MSMVGTFDGFTAARLGIYAAQHGLRVTGNNVANINTLGYTRQRADQVSFKVGNNDMYRSFYDNHVGSGSLVSGINQIRDPYLDIRYRNASTDTYHYDTWLAGLQGIASILDEVGKGDNKDGLIYKAIQDLAEKLRAYSADPTSLNDRLVRNSAESLTALFHNAATRLETLYNETEKEFKESVSVVNEILTNIRDLNKSIREAEIHGDPALEMRDERNRQIDKLSQYLDISVEYSFEDVGAGVQVEKLTIKLNNANPDITVHTDESILVDGEYATQLSVPKEKPALNTYDGYLKGYTYLQKVSLEDAQDFLKAINEKNPDNTPYTDDDLVTVTEKDAEGNDVTYYLIGTNDSDVDGIVTEANDNFTIQLSKLLNSKGAEWKSSSTSWAEVTDATGLGFATRTYDVNSTLKAGDTFGILQANGTTKTFTVVADDATDEQLANITNPVRISEVTGDNFAVFVANELRKSGRYSDYSITAENSQVIFTAKTPGAVGSGKGAPADWPKLETNDPFSTNLIGATQADESDGYLPADDTTTYDEHGRVTKSVSYVMADGRLYRVTVSTEYTHEVTLDDNDLHGILQAQRELLTEEGEFASAKDVAIDESALTKRGIRYYQQSLDLLAQKFAEAYNRLNSGYAYNQDGYYIDKDGNPLQMQNPDLTYDYVRVDGLTDSQLQNLLANGYYLKDKDGNPIDEKGNLITDENGNPIQLDDEGKLSPDDYDKVVVDMDRLMEELKGVPMGGELFTQLDGKTTTGITAKTISISHGWSNGLWNLVPTFKMLFTDSGGLTHSTQNDNADHMVAMIDKALTYNPRDLFGSDAIGPELFSGSFNDMLSNMMAVEGEDASITNVRLTTYATALNELDYSREGVSGVDLNDEAMNMVQYQKAMTAAMRVMTTIDEVLDRLINNTGIAGR